MCGIVGYVGEEQAAPFLVDGLRRLEYRGYDSAGVAVHDGYVSFVESALTAIRRSQLLLLDYDLLTNERQTQPPLSGTATAMHALSQVFVRASTVETKTCSMPLQRFFAARNVS